MFHGLHQPEDSISVAIRYISASKANIDTGIIEPDGAGIPNGPLSLQFKPEEKRFFILRP